MGSSVKGSLDGGSNSDVTGASSDVMSVKDRSDEVVTPVSSGTGAESADSTSIHDMTRYDMRMHDSRSIIVCV